MEYGPAPEAANLANAWLEAHDRKFGSYIGGKWIFSPDTFATLNPSTGEEIAQIAQGSAKDVDMAVKAAKTALPGWQKLTPTERAKYLYALARHVQKHSRLYAVLESMDNGKPIRESRDIDIPLVARHFYYHAGWATLVGREFADYEPVGVCGQIIPWNFPLLMLAWKIAPALAAGNTVVLKPAEFTSLTALLFAEACEQIGLPGGVVNIVTGDGSTGAAIVEHPDVDKVAFTGSTEVGRIIRAATAGTGRKLSLELGGKSPFVIFEDADLDGAVEGLVDAIWFNQGQVCCAGSRLLVQESVAEVVHKKIRARMEKFRVGDPLDKSIDVGAIVDKVQLERIESLVRQGCAEGAEMFQSPCPLPDKGCFYPPTLLANVAPASTVAQVEIFGPVLVSMTFRTYAEAIALANNTKYGLAASVWSENLNTSLDVASNLKAGTVWVNCTNQFDASSGFGGYRESGFGREGGGEGLLEYLKPRRIEPLEIEETTASEIDLAGEALIDRTHKQYIGGKQARPDSGYSITMKLADGSRESFARGNRKDVRNAVEAARIAQTSWAKQSAYLRSQVLYYLAENLSGERSEIHRALTRCGYSESCAASEFECAVGRLMEIAAWTDKFEGTVHQVPMRGMAYTQNEPVGVIAIVCPSAWPLLSLITLGAAAIAMGNSIVQLPSEIAPLPAALFYRVLEASDVPGGVWNILTGPHSEMERTLAEHEGVEAIWHFGREQAASEAESLSIGNLKQTWTTCITHINWVDPNLREVLRHATQVKNVWVPYGA